MENKEIIFIPYYRQICKGICVILLFSVFTGLFADSGLSIPSGHSYGKNKSYTTSRSKDGKIVFYQLLSWEAFDDILGFEFILEKKEPNNNWKLAQKKFLKENFIEVSLSPGDYRFRVSVINLLEQHESPSEYHNFTVIPAYEPVIYSISPKNVYLEEKFENFFVISGKEFHSGTEFILTRPDGSSIKGKILNIEKNGQKAKVSFNLNKVSPGEYLLKVKDKSGLEDGRHSISFKFEKPFDFYISGGYVFTGLFASRPFKEYFNTSIAPLGGGLRMTFVPFKRIYGTFGFNVSINGGYVKNRQPDYILKSGILFAQFNAAYIRPLVKNRLKLNVHAGIGTMSFLQTQFIFTDTKSPVTSYWGLTFEAGTALQIFLYKKLYIEVNLDHIIPVHKHFPKYILQPAISLGWQF